MYQPDPSPKWGDSENTLLGKWLEILGGEAKPGDSDHMLLYRIALLLSTF